MTDDKMYTRRSRDTYHLFTYSVPCLGLPWLGVLAGPGLANDGKIQFQDTTCTSSAVDMQ